MSCHCPLGIYDFARPTDHQLWPLETARVNGCKILKNRYLCNNENHYEKKVSNLQPVGHEEKTGTKYFQKVFNSKEQREYIKTKENAGNIKTWVELFSYTLDVKKQKRYLEKKHRKMQNILKFMQHIKIYGS